MENNILELECSEQPISAYQAIGLIDCNISAQGSGMFRNQIYFQNDVSRAIELSQFTQMAGLLRLYNRHFGNLSDVRTLNKVCDHVKQ